MTNYCLGFINQCSQSSSIRDLTLSTDYADYDFSILELEQPIVFRDSAKALFLPDPEDDKRVKNQKFLVSGWGRTNFEGPPSWEKLLTVTVPWISDSECSAAYVGEEMYVKEESMVCAGDTKSGGIDACIGDSGGKSWFKKVS